MRNTLRLNIGKKKMHIRILLLLILPVVAVAGPTPKQVEMGRDLATLLRVQDMFEAYLKECIASDVGGVFDPETVFRVDPDVFGGLSPQSAYWPQLEEVYREFQREACAYLTSDGFHDFYAQKYAEYLSEEELQDAIAFYSSPAGRRVREVDVRINEEFQVNAQEQLSSAYSKAYKRFSEDLKIVMRKYQREPK